MVGICQILVRTPFPPQSRFFPDAMLNRLYRSFIVCAIQTARVTG